MRRHLPGLVRRALFAGLVTLASLAAVRPSFAFIRINELNLGCSDGSREVAFIELKAVTADQFDSQMGIEVHGPGDVLLADIPHVFGSHTGAFPAGRAFLVATPAFAMITGFESDATLPVTPDPEVGRIALYRPRPDGSHQVLDQFSYGPTALEPPPPGWSLVWVGFSRSLSSQPTPENFADGAIVSSCFGAGQPVAGSATWDASELMTACESGSTASQFLELRVTGYGIIRSASFLRVFDHAGNLQGQLDHFFGPYDSYYVGAGTRALLANGFTGQDATLPFPLDTLGGHAEMWDGTYLYFSFHWGNGHAPAPPPGQSVEWSEGGWRISPTPSPTTIYFNTVSPLDGACYSPSAAGAQISEVLFQCEDGSAAQPFVELGSTRYDAHFAPGLVLESYGHDGALLQTVPLDFGSVAGNTWYPGTTWLVAGAPFRDMYRSPYLPDTRVSPVFDLAGGVLKLVHVRSSGGRSTIDSLVYGAASVPLPAPGLSLQRGTSGAWMSGHATPQHVTGGVGFDECLDLCPYSAVELDTSRFESPASGYWGATTATGQAYLDNTAGQFSIDIYSPVSGLVEWADEFVAGGAPAGAPVQLHLVAYATLFGQAEACWLGSCRKGAASLDVEVPGRHAGFAAIASGFRDSTIDVPFTVTAGQPFRLLVRARALLTAGGIGTVPFFTRSSAAASFQLRHSDPYVTLTSCKGFGAIGLLSTTGVEPPAGSGATRLAVRQVTPNPARGASRLTFVLPRAGDVQVDVLDVAGRRVAAREWSAMAAGEHVVPLAGSGELPPGFYLVRVRQGGESATTRLLVTR